MPPAHSTLRAAQNSKRIHARSTERWNEACQHSRDHRDHEREAEDVEIETKLDGSRSVEGEKPQEQAVQSESQSDSTEAPEDGQERALDEKCPNDPTPTGTKSESDDGLA